MHIALLAVADRVAVARYRMICLVLESKDGICTSLCYLSNIDIFQYVTQNSS